VSAEDGGEPAERVRDLLEQVLGACGLQGEVGISEDEETLVGTIDGDDLGVLIGRRGQTIDALQHLALRVAFAGDEPRKRVVIDAGGYRARREEALRRSADQAVADATEQGRPVALEPMPAAERRYVHEYLRDAGRIETYSEGEEPDRHLVVAPLVS
jgi:spoIIIJ-associated protein